MSFLEDVKAGEDFLEHVGVKGMKWGVNRSSRVIKNTRWGIPEGYKISRSQSYKERRDVNRANKQAFKKAAKENPNFKTEVKLTKEGRGIRTTGLEAEFTKKGGLLTNRMLGNFKDSQGRKVSNEFGNAVYDKIMRQQRTKQRIATGISFAATLGLSAAILKVSR
jgi:hypothetical protein